MEYNVIDADGHVLEPPDLWEQYIEPRFRDRCPKLFIRENGAEVLRIEDDAALDFGRGKKPITFGTTGSFGARDGSVSPRIPYLQGKPGGFDPHARIPDMDAEGIDAAFLYPSLGLFMGAIKDPEFSAAVCRAYNRWLADYCKPYPGTAVRSGDAADAIGGGRDAARCVLRRVSSGFRTGFIRPNPYNGRMLHDADYDPLWEAGAGPRLRNRNPRRFGKRPADARRWIVSRGAAARCAMRSRIPSK